jgi:hypothetical protein
MIKLPLKGTKKYIYVSDIDAIADTIWSELVDWDEVKKYAKTIN